MGERIASVVESLRDGGSKRAILVSHGAPIRFGIAQLMDASGQNWGSFQAQFDNASVSLLRYDAGAWEAVFTNYLPYLNARQKTS